MGTGVGAACLLITGLIKLSPESHPAPVLADDEVLGARTEAASSAAETYQGSFYFHTKEEMLQDLGVTVFPEDKITAFPDPSFGVGSVITITRAPVVMIRDGKQETQARSWRPTVGEVLSERRIEVGDQDRVNIPLTTPVSSLAGPIVITRVSESTLHVKKDIPYETQTVDDPELERGTTHTEQAGAAGTLQVTYLIHREDGLERWRKETERTVLKEPVTKIIRIGTKVVHYGSGKASWYAGVGAMTAAHRTLPKGTRVRVVNANNGKSVVVTIADRGPFIDGRIIDLSRDAFAEIAPLGSGVATVRVEKE